MLHKKVVFMGTPGFSVSILEAIAKSSYKISCVYTQESKKSNRGQKLNNTPVFEQAKKLRLTVRNPKNLNTEEELKFLRELNPDIVLVVAYGQLISKEFLNIPKEGFINIHASLLPKWRGAAPMQRSIMNSETETGVSIMKITEGLDAGPVMKKIKVKIDETITTAKLSKNLSKISSDIIVKVLNDIFNKNFKFIEQNHKLATYAKKIKKNEAEINWNEPAKMILAKINGLNPKPGAWFKYKNTRYKIWEARIVEKKGTPGTILNDNFIICYGDKSLEIIEIQKEGKNKLTLKSFLMGLNFKKDDVLK